MWEWGNHPWVVSYDDESLNAPGKKRGETLFCSSLISQLFSISCYSISIRYGLDYMLARTLRTTLQSSYSRHTPLNTKKQRLEKERPQGHVETQRLVLDLQAVLHAL